MVLPHSVQGIGATAGEFAILNGSFEAIGLSAVEAGGSATGSLSQPAPTAVPKPVMVINL